MVNTRLLGVTVHLPNGQAKKFKADEVIAYGAAPTIAVAVREDGKIRKYLGFPTEVHEEELAVDLVTPLVVHG